VIPEGRAGAAGGVADLGEQAAQLRQRRDRVGGEILATRLGGADDDADRLQEGRHADRLAIALAVAFGRIALGMVALRGLAFGRFAPDDLSLRPGHGPGPEAHLQPDAHAHGEEAMPELGGGLDEGLVVVVGGPGDAGEGHPDGIGALDHGRDHADVASVGSRI
jgi:hypothetical protein